MLQSGKFVCDSVAFQGIFENCGVDYLTAPDGNIFRI